MQMALNLAVMNATNEIIFVVNDDNVFCTDYDEAIHKTLLNREKTVVTVNQIEPTGPGIFNFPVKDFGKNPKEFKYEEFIKYENELRKEKITIDGGIFPFVQCINSIIWLLVGLIQCINPHLFVIGIFS